MTSLIAPPGGGDDLEDVEEEVDNIQVEVQSSEDVLLRRQGVLKRVKILLFPREPRKPVLRIRDILVRIRIRGSVPCD